MTDGGTGTPLPPHPDRKTCRFCGEHFFNEPAHREECRGPVFRCDGPERSWIRDQFARDNDGA